MTEFEEKIYKNGSIKLSHTLAKGITPHNAIVLSRLIKERDYAVENNYITEDGFFIADERELSYHTGLSQDAVCNITTNLFRRKLVQYKKIDEYELIRIDDEKIIAIVNELETDEPKDYGNWDKDLKKVQKEILKLDITKKENNNETAIDTNKKVGGLTITRNIEKDNSNDKPDMPEHMQ